MASKKTFNHKLEETVTIIDTKTQAKVIGRASYISSDPAYLLRYVDGTNTMREDWISENAVESDITI